MSSITLLVIIGKEAYSRCMLVSNYFTWTKHKAFIRWCLCVTEIMRSFDSYKDMMNTEIDRFSEAIYIVSILLHCFSTLIQIMWFIGSFFFDLPTFYDANFLCMRYLKCIFVCSADVCDIWKLYQSSIRRGYRPLRLLWKWNSSELQHLWIKP